ncbi:MAG: putative 2OG-Fe(II) oxygenase [Sphingomicrobium sp.]
MANSSETMSYEELEARARVLENERKLVEARDAYDAALRLEPMSQRAAEGRARIAIQLNEECAADHCARALAFHDADPELQCQMIETAAVELGSAAIPLFESFLDRHPDNVTGHELLSDLRAQADAGDAFLNYKRALDADPGNKPLLTSYWNMLTRSGRLAEALDSMDANRSLFEGDREFALLEVNTANHAGLTDRAGQLLDRLDDRPDAQLARGQHRLQTGRPDEAADLLESVIDAQPGNLNAWAFLEIAWRLTGDPRHGWLADQPGLVDDLQLSLTDAQLEEIAAMLRTIHRSRSQPIGQSVRGGTQTLGQLFLRSEPEILQLTQALTAAIRQFVGNLPPADPRHPLLRHRNMGMAFGPSWSVRLAGGGFHAAHFHPGGILSSACYIRLPDDLAGSPEQSGWLEIGRPPPELGLELPPLATFEPKEGHLVLFPSYLFHGTRPFAGGERLTVAFDLVAVPMT